MAGAGPAITHIAWTDSGTFWGLSSVVDLMGWPKKNVGWYVEPGYEVAFMTAAAIMPSASLPDY
jgi:hypothetical protein